MTRAEVAEEIHRIIQSAVNRGGGNWHQGFRFQVEQIFTVMGKLSPERDGNIRKEVPNYNKHLVRKVRKPGQPKVKFTPEQRNNARALLRKMGMI